ncbi:hypothetical protein AB0J83_08165 [Actinoplanes sp. NPDC049596]|uniref:hypothetical protein n=1 Tax=unclassified Actinoplanes TaxID=2626549 RepID=UPI00342F475C
MTFDRRKKSFIFLAESAFRLNIAVPLVALLAPAAWRSSLPIGLRVALTGLAFGYGAILVSQAVMRAVQSRDVIAQALVVGILESKALPRLGKSKDHGVGVGGQGSAAGVTSGP